MIGDHHQLPPVIKNMAFQKYSNMEQSLFTRCVRLGVPTVDLDAQGRARPRYALVLLIQDFYLFTTGVWEVFGTSKSFLC